MAVVILDYSEFRSMFPIFSDSTIYPDAMLDIYFSIAEEYISNNECSKTSLKTRKNLLYLTLAHLLLLLSGNKDGSTVGRVANATQGSVSVGLSYPISPNSAWWTQTQYGAMVWELTKKYRSFFSIELDSCYNYSYRVFI